jgi:hypothetical protein
MNLRSLVNPVTSSTVNENVNITILKSTGYTIGEGRKQIATYAAPVVTIGQLQALDGKDLKQIEGLNIQGTIRALYIYQDIKGTSRPDQTGGDIITFNGQTWLTVKVLEGWQGKWTKVAIVLQDTP